MSETLATQTATLNKMIIDFAKELWGIDLPQPAAMKIVHTLIADMSNGVADNIAE